jgi:multidrug efflux pump subunit AcrA (membrane-fusion protein)
LSTAEYSQPDAEAVARAKREIQGLIQEIAELSRTDVAAEEFYDALLNRVVAALAAVGGAVWTIGDSGALQLVYQINLRETGLLENPTGQQQHFRLLNQVMQGSEGTLVAPHSGHAGGSDDDASAAANPTDYLLVLGPVLNDQGPQGVVEVFQRGGGRPATQRGYLRFLMQTCELAGDFLRRQRLSHLSDKQSLWEQLESFTRLAHEKLEVRQTAFTVANEGRRLIGCDRVSVAIQRGRRCPIEAVSGQDTFDKRSNQIVLLGKLARAVTKTGEAVWYTGDTTDYAPQVEKAVDAYVDEAHTKAMAVLPLVEPQDEEDLRENKTPPKVIGALIVEQMVDSRPPEGFMQRVEVVRGHCASALTNALEHEGLFLMPVWKTLGKATQLFRGRTLPKSLAVIALVVGLISAAVFVPYDFTMQAEGKLRPKTRAHVWAALNGKVRDVLVEHDEELAAGQLLVVQESVDLETEIKDVEGKLLELEAQIYSAKIQNGGDTRDGRERSDQERAAAIEGFKTQKETLEKRLDLLRTKQKDLEIYSPIAGHVTTWEPVQQLKGRTVTPGEKVLSIADPAGDWELEVFMPESKMRHVQKAWHESGDELTATFILATHPADSLEGHVVEVDRIAEVRGDAGNTVLVRIEFDQNKLREVVGEPKVNSGVTVKIHCGKQPIGYVLLHSLFDAFKREVMFRFG